MSGRENNNSKKNQEEDFASVKLVLQGDKYAFKNLEQKYKNIITALIRRMVKNEDDIQDLVQESFIKAFNALSSFQFGYSFSAWLYRIASNTCIDFLRKKRFPTISINQPINNKESDYFFEIEDNTFKPDLDVLSEERKNALNDAIDQLPENYRKIIKLRHEEEMDYKDISEMLNIPLGTVKAHLFRARKILLLALQKKKELFTDM